jgi:branched-chain amino acid transport system substrate-binding protein
MQKLSIGLAILLMACGSGNDKKLATAPADAENTVRIGLLFPMSGPWVKGPAWRNAAEINASGGVLGRPIELLIADTQTVPEVAATQAQFLIDQQVTAIVGAAASSSTILSASTTTIPSGVLLVSPASTSPALTALDDQDLVWRTVASDLFQGRVAAQWAYEEGARTAGILFVDNVYGQGLSAAFTAEFERLGGSVETPVDYPELSSDDINDFSYDSRVNSVFSGNPDLVYLITYDQDGAKITVSAANHITDSYRPIFLGCDGNQSQAFADNSAPNVIEGMVGALPIAPEGSDIYRAFADEYRKLYGVAPESFSESTYDAIYLGAAGAVDFDINGDVESGTYRIWRVENGAFVTLGKRWRFPSVAKRRYSQQHTSLSA